MKILIYGAGVLGSYLAHVLIRGNNQVTLLARGQRLTALEENGLIIRHYAQLRTTKDQVNLIKELVPEDIYDLIFVVMQYTQLSSVLPYIANSHSQNIIFVGNNADAEQVQKYILENSPIKKQLGFGFQSTGGRRDKGQILCVRAQGHMELGGLHEDLSFKPLVDSAFANTNYKLTYYNNMNAWYKSHIAMILPLCFAAYACNGDLRKASGNSKLLNQIINAIDEGYAILETLGYPILPASEKDFVRKKRLLFYFMLKIVTLTPIGRLAISDHAISAVEEITALNKSFDELKQKASLSVPNWDSLEHYLT